MKIMMILLLIGLLAGFYPRSGKEEGADAPGKREKWAYISMSFFCLVLGVLNYINFFPTIADWMDDVMEIFFRATGGSST